MTTELTIVEQKPAEIVIGGRDAAKELTKIVGSRKRKLVMAGKTYLFFEDWQTIGRRSSRKSLIENRWVDTTLDTV